MGRAQSDTYSSLFTKSDNVNLDETFDKKSALVYVLNYRPISVLSFFSKVFERVVYNRVLDFLCKNNVLYDLNSEHK